VGCDENDSYSGHSLIVNPLGEIICEAQDKEEVIIQNINLSEVEFAREKLPYLSDIYLNF